MANSGKLALQDDGSYAGRISTLELRLPIKLEPTNSKTKNAPDYRVFSGEVEIGAAWEKTSEATGTMYYNMQLDDPSFEQTLYFRLFQNKVDSGSYDIVWDRSRAN